MVNGVLILAAAWTLAVPESPYLAKARTDDCVKAVPTLTADGFKVGPKWLKADSGQNVVVYTDGGKQRFRVFARVRPEFKYYSPVSRLKGELTGKVLRRTAPVAVLKSKKGPKEKVEGTYVSTLELLDDGTCKMTFDVEVAGAEGVHNSSEFVLTREFLDECSFEVEAEGHPAADQWTRPKRVTVKDADGAFAFALAVDPNEVSSFVVNRGSATLSFRHPRGNRFSVTLDPGETLVPKKPPFLAGGVDFWAESGAHVAEYQSSPNVLMNPSFESGERYWRGQVDDDVRTIVTNGVAHSGRRCLDLDKVRHSCVQSACLVLKSDTDYAFSAWIRPKSGVGGAQLKAQLRGVRGKKSILKQLVLSKAKADGAWERVSGRMSTPADFHECVLWLDGKDVFVDDIQIEEGTEMSAYAGNPFGLELVTDQPTDVYADAKKPQNLRLRVSGPAGAKGRLAVKGYDVFDRQLLRKVFDFAIGADGTDTIALGKDADWPLGTFVFAVRLKADGVDYWDYLRFSKIDARDGKDRLRGLQGTQMFGRFKASTERPAYHYERLRDFGFGTLAYSGNANAPTYDRLTQADVDNLARYGLKDRWGGLIWAAAWKKTLNGKPWQWEGQDVRALTNYPAALLQWVEDETCAMAKSVPWIDFWAIDTEPRGHWATLRRDDVESYAKLMLAFNRGLVRANPANVFIPFGACNMVPHSGSDYVVDFLKTARRIDPSAHFRQIEIHTYRQLPEHPDVDADLSYFLKELDKAGYPDMKVKTGEGSYYYPFWRPSSNLYSWSHVSGKDGYSAVRIPTYDIGWGERIGAALVIRESLVYFKHQDRVNANCCWCPETVDSRAPIAWTAANAALMAILGNATFVEDVRFAKNCRALVFDDGKGRTAAAVWRGAVRYDHGLGREVPCALCLAPGAVEVLDLMGNRCEVKVEGEGEQRMVRLPLSGFPVYLRVENGKRAALVKALKGAQVARGASDTPEGTVQGDASLREALPEERKVGAAHFAGAKPDWTAVKAVAEGPLSWQVAWNERAFCFRATVKEGLANAPKVDLRFDGFANARENFGEGEKGHDYDDFVYQLRLGEAARGASGTPTGGMDRTAECYRVRAPDHQLTGGAGYGFVGDVVEPGVTVEVRAEGKGATAFEATFPARFLMPVKLKPGEKIGFSAESDRFATTANKPHLFMTMEFVK